MLSEHPTLAAAFEDDGSGRGPVELELVRPPWVVARVGNQRNGPSCILHDITKRLRTSSIRSVHHSYPCGGFNRQNDDLRRGNSLKSTLRLVWMSAALTAVVSGPAWGQSPPSVAPMYTGVRDEQSLRDIVESHFKRADAIVRAVLAVKGTRTVFNTVEPYDRLRAEIEDAGSLANLISRVHPDERMRAAGETLARSAVAKEAELSLRRDLYDALRAVSVTGLDPATTRLLEREMRDYRLAGVDQPEEIRLRLQQLRTDLQTAEQTFDRNLRDGQRTFTATEDELDGLPPDFRARHQATPPGAIALTTADVDAQPVLQYASSEALRKRMQAERWRVALPANITVLQHMLRLRHDIATLLGFPNWAEYHAQTRMAADVGTISTFLTTVMAAMRPAASAEHAQLLARKQQDQPAATLIEPWDVEYYKELVTRASYNFDSQSVRPYFKYAQVRDGLFQIAGRLFDVSFRRASVATWHPDVEVVEMVRGSTLLGRIYLDAHPRPNKNASGASAVRVRSGARGWQLPETVIVASWPGGAGDDSGLLSHRQVVQFFHEFGHAIHVVFGGSTQLWTRLNGFTIETDAGEAPAAVLEEWAWDARTTSEFARHHVTGEPLPADVLARMRRAGEFGKALYEQETAVRARVSLDLHVRDPQELDVMSVAASALAQRTLVRWADPEMVAQFRHLANPRYTSAYYTYLWSDVIAKDLLSRFNRADLLDSEIARQYRDKVLVPGASKPAAQLFQDFLGRPFDLEAFRRWINDGTPAAAP